MPTQTMPQTPLGAIQYAQSTHLTQHHGDQLRPHEDCPTCLALHRAVQVAHQPPLARATGRRSA